MVGPYVHQIDPILFEINGLYCWWYGLGFAVGFLELHLFLRRGHEQLHLSLREVWSLSLFMAIGVLVGGRAVEIAFDEWPFYREHLRLIPAFWLGGMATHGLLLGGAAVFALQYRKPFRLLADALVIPAAFLMGSDDSATSSTARSSAPSRRCRGRSSFRTRTGFATPWCSTVVRRTCC